jgi:hypothetical protein
MHEKAGGCITHGNSGRPDECHRTSCPVCGHKVYFVRHNGGVVWFNELGAPWDKHGCMVGESNSDPVGPALHFRLMRIRHVIRCHFIEDGPGFQLTIGYDRKPGSGWNLFPTDPSENPLAWKGRYCYLASSEGTLTFFNGDSYHVDPYMR